MGGADRSGVQKRERGYRGDYGRGWNVRSWSSEKNLKRLKRAGGPVTIQRENLKKKGKKTFQRGGLKKC